MCCCCRKKQNAYDDQDIELLEDGQLIELVSDDSNEDEIVVSCQSPPDPLPNCAAFVGYDKQTEWAMPEITTEDNIVLTGRTLFLREVLNTHVIRRRFPLGEANPKYLGQYKVSGWNAESYSSLLRLTDRDLAQLRGAEILDLGGGQGLFIEEAALIGITVTSVDINRKRYIELKDELTGPFLGQQVNVNQITHEEKARAAYVKNMEAIYCRNQSDAFIHPEILKTFNTLFGHRNAIASSFMDTDRRVQGSALDLRRFKDNAFDAVISVWMLCYLSEEDRAQVVAEAVRVTKRGGQIRLYGGDNTSGRREAIGEASLREWFKKSWPKVGGKRCTLDEERTEGGLVVMTVR